MISRQIFLVQRNCIVTNRWNVDFSNKPFSSVNSVQNSSKIDDERKKNLIKLELANLRDLGHRDIPQVSLIKPQHWNELLTKESPAARRKFYRFLYVTQTNVENAKVSEKHLDCGPDVTNEFYFTDQEGTKSKRHSGI